jgi:RNA polymerase sigma factor (sigma-70 family)
MPKPQTLNKEYSIRLENLYRNHYTWLLQVGKNITKNTDDAKDLISELFLYLGTKRNPKIFYDDSYNLMYCRRFMQTRWINHIHKVKKTQLTEDIEVYDDVDEEYNIEKDIELMKTYELIIKEIDELAKTKMWPRAKLFQLYYMSDDTMIEVANKIGISKSTTFISIKKIREHLKSIINNPFNNEQ